MPELPEVEIVKQSLVKNVKSQKILQVIVRNRNLRFKLPINFKNIIKKQKIINVRRFSKYIIIEFSNKLYCILHLGMSGTLHIVKKDKKNVDEKINLILLKKIGKTTDPKKISIHANQVKSFLKLYFL